jgi:mannose-6-phosphate isomerase-like protein (cupin superfamily)
MVRRVVSGTDAQGKACVSIDGEPAKVFANGGFSFEEIWATEPPAPDLKDKRDIAAGLDQFSMDLAPGATRFRIAEFPPMDAGQPGSLMHKTPTIDYLIILEGEIDLLFDDGSEVHLKQGDCIVQCGVMHSWRNRSGRPVRMAAVAVGAIGGESAHL